MSTFKVEVKTISEIRPHSNADRLEIGKVTGLDFQFVIEKNKYLVGELVVYFPVDSILPQNLIDHLEITYLSGPLKNRVKTIKLRGEYSQGIIVPIKKFSTILPKCKNGQNVTKLLGVIKFEPPEKMTLIGRIRRLPLGLKKYDIEGYERYPKAVKFLKEKNVQVTEKLEGCNFSFSLTSKGKEFVNSRNNTLIELKYSILQRLKNWWYGYKKPRKKNLFWEAFRNQPNIKLGANILLEKYKCNWVTVYGELCGQGIQKNIYNINGHKIFIFDVLTDKGWIDPKTVFETFSDDHVPVLFEGKFSDYLENKTISEKSNGKSQLAPIMREGIVIKPFEPQQFPGLGRLILKKRSPEYLSKTEN